MTLVETKLFLREPAAVFFALAFPVIILVLFTSIFGNKPSPAYNGLRSVDVSVPSYAGFILGSVALIGLPIALASYKEQGVLRRLRATPLHPAVVIGAHVIVNLLMTTLGMAVLVVSARLVYGLQPPAAPLAVVLAFGLSSLSFFALGCVIAGLVPSARVATFVGQALFFPMLFLSGAALPFRMLPETLQHIAELLPLTHAVTLIRDLWLGEGWNLAALVVLMVFLIGATIVSAYTFHWE
jgi:ABC-2 type transport system permease protein